MTPIRLSFSLNVAPKGKERPRVTRHGTYMPKEYEAWREIVRWQVRSQVPARILGLLPLAMPLSFNCVVSSPHGDMKPDLDNLIGAIWDAIQVPRKGGWGLIVNDKQIKKCAAEITAGTTSIRFGVEEVSDAPHS